MNRKYLSIKVISEGTTHQVNSFRKIKTTDFYTTFITVNTHFVAMENIL